MSLHRLFLAVWLVDLVLVPVLAVLQLGYSVSIISNYYARFGYLAVLALAAAYHVAGRRSLVLPVISLVFVGIALVGGLRGLAYLQLNRAFLAHVFYCLMPIVMISYGWHFMADHRKSLALRRALGTVMFAGFYAGAGATLAFLLGGLLGVARYDALGLWNFFFAGPFMAYQPGGAAYFAASIIGTLLAAKRSMLLVFVVLAALYFLFLPRRTRRMALIVAPAAIALAFVVMSDSLSLTDTRMYRSIRYMAAGDFDAATANRWAESESAIRYLSARPRGLALGAGFGAQFLPWPDKPEYAGYYQHYTHFGFISYAFFGGFLAPFAIYGVLGVECVRLIWLAVTRRIRRQDYTFPMWFAGILVVSLGGAVLMNNSFLWFVIGSCLRLRKLASMPRPAAAVTV